MNATASHRAAQPPLRADEFFTIVVAAALLTAPVCRVFRTTGEQLRARWWGDDDDDDDADDADADDDDDGTDGYRSDEEAGGRRRCSLS